MAELTFNSIWKWLRRISPMNIALSVFYNSLLFKFIN